MTKRTQVNTALYLLLACAGIGSIATAQQPVPYVSPSTHSAPIYPNQTPGVLVTRMWDWTTDAWDGNDKPYQEARLAIDQAVVAHQDLDLLLRQNKAKAESRPNDPLALFRWAYVAYQVTLAHKSRTAGFKAMDGVQEAFYHTPSGHTYNYARMQFLVGEFYTANHQAVPAAKRLLQVDGNDYLVNYYLAAIYLEDYASPDFQRIFDVCSRLRHLYPEKSSVYALTGEAYILRWHQERVPAFAQGVVENYKRYLELAPSDDDFRKQAQNIIKEFEPRTKSG